MKAYVLAAGYGTRMFPLTRDRPKALLEVGGGPILTSTVERLRALEDLTEVVIITNERFFGPMEAWLEHQDPWVPFTLLSDGTTSEAERLGALGDLAFGLQRVPVGEEDAIVLASDHFMELDLGEVQRAFRARGRTTVVVRPVEPGRGPSRYNDVELGKDRRIVRFREKPDDPKGDLAAICLYLFPSEVIARLDEYLDDGERDAPGHFIAWLVERVPCYPFELTTPWYDIGNLESLAEARARFG